MHTACEQNRYHLICTLRVNRIVHKAFIQLFATGKYTEVKQQQKQKEKVAEENEIGNWFLLYIIVCIRVQSWEPDEFSRDRGGEVQCTHVFMLVQLCGSSVGNEQDSGQKAPPIQNEQESGGDDSFEQEGGGDASPVENKQEKGNEKERGSEKERCENQGNNTTKSTDIKQVEKGIQGGKYNVSCVTTQ